MKRVLLWLWLLIKRQLKSPAVIVFLVGMPVLCLLVTALPAMQEEGVPRVGLVAEDADETAQKTMERLTGGEYSVDFYEAPSREILAESILKGETAHGYVFSGQLTQKLDARNLKGSIFLLKEDSGFLSAMTNEIVFAELFRVYGLNIAVNYVAESDLFVHVRPAALAAVKERYAQYGAGSETFHLDFEMLEGSGGTAELKASGAVFPIRGVLAVLVFMAGLYGGVWWMTEQEEGMFVAIPKKLVQWGRFLYIAVPTVLFAVSAELTLALTHTGNFPFELLKMLGYVCLIVGFTAVLTWLLPGSKWMLSALPVFALASLIICPVFVNLTTVIPGLRYLCWGLMPYYYL